MLFILMSFLFQIFYTLYSYLNEKKKNKKQLSCFFLFSFIVNFKCDEFLFVCYLTSLLYYYISYPPLYYCI